MPTNVLIVDSNVGFSGMLKQVLEEGGQFRVTAVPAGGAAVETASAHDFDLAVVDMDLPDVPAPDVIRGLRAARPRLAIMAIPVDNNPDAPALRGLDLQGFLTKPFFIPDLGGMLEQALRQPAGGQAPPPREAIQPLYQPAPEPAPDVPTFQRSPLRGLRNLQRSNLQRSNVQRSPPARPQFTRPPGLSASEPARPARAEQPAPPWLEDVNKAAQYLARLSLETSAHAALLTRGPQLWAYAGQFDQPQAAELTRLVDENWSRDGIHGATARFVRVAPAEGDYLLYSIGAAGDMVLSLVFQAETPIGMIRKQARFLADALTRTPPPAEGPRQGAPAAGPGAGSPRPPAGAGSDSRAGGVSPARTPAPLPGRLAPPPAPEAAPAPGPAQQAGLSIADDWTALRSVPPQVETEAPSPLPENWPAREALPSVLEAYPEMEPAPPELEFPRAVAGLEAPGVLVQLNYTFVFVPKFPRYRLAGDLVPWLGEWLRHYAVAFHWRVNRLYIRPDHVQISLTCPPTTAPERVARQLKRLSSEKIFQEFPRLVQDDPNNDFWAPAYLLLGGGELPSPQQILEYIAHVRRQQGLAGG
ncbi:MAG: IS200/IS605 family transposase [Chloroflexi bacterium]|nr:IS200/IS605 family transposase [Chloroflexota bacterium]